MYRRPAKKCFDIIVKITAYSAFSKNDVHYSTRIWKSILHAQCKCRKQETAIYLGYFTSILIDSIKWEDGFYIPHQKCIHEFYATKRSTPSTACKSRDFMQCSLLTACLDTKFIIKMKTSATATAKSRQGFSRYEYTLRILQNGPHF